MSLTDLVKAKQAAVAPTTNPQITAAPGTAPGMPRFNIPAANTPVQQSRLRAAIGHLSKARTGSPRNKLPLGTGWFVLKHGQYKVTDRQSHITAFSVQCIRGISDEHGLLPTASTYTGPKVGEVYDLAIFHDTKYPEVFLSQCLSIVQACMGWPKDYLEQLKAYLATGPADTDPTVQEINQIFGQTFGVDLNGLPMDVPCMFSNQIVLELKTTAQVKTMKAPNGQDLYDAAGQKVTKTYINTYWQKRIMLDEVLKIVPQEEILRGFGDEAAFMVAYNAEKQAPTA